MKETREIFLPENFDVGLDDDYFRVICGEDEVKMADMIMV